jgi:hypothetical protein
MDKYEGDSQYMNEPEGTIHEYEITYKWDDRSAGNIYTVTRFSAYPNGERRITYAWCGDAAWAGRMAKHYNIELPVEEENK